MKKYLFLIFTSVIFISSCAENQTRIGEGAAIGGILGAGVGGIIGHQTHDDAAGILIGGAVGAASGAVVGSQIEKQPQNNRQVSPVVSQVTMGQIVDWTKQGLNSDEIISRIKTANSSYFLTADDISYLRREGVGQRVIESMQVTK